MTDKDKRETEIKRAWDMFGPDGQDMSFKDFRQALLDMADPIKMKEDLDEILMRKAIFNTNKARVDRKLNG